MKRSKVLLAISLVVAITAAMLVGCVPPVEIDLRNGWAPLEGESVYNIKNETNGDLTLGFTKSDTYQLTKYVISSEPADLAKIKTLSFTGLMTSDGDRKVLIKVAYVAGASSEKEVVVQMKATSATYEWDISALPNDKLVSIMIFAEPGDNDAKGTIKLTEIKLTEKAAVEANRVGVALADQKVNDITATALTANAEWRASNPEAEGVYTLSIVDGKVKVDYDKGTSEWVTVKALVRGSALSTMKKMVIKVQGTKDKELLIKPYDKIEKRHTFTGNVDTIEVDLTGHGITDFSVILPIYLFAEPGTPGVTGTFYIIDLAFSTAAIAA